MGTIDKHLFEKAGARGCEDSDYNLAITSCCKTYVVEDTELSDLYFDPNDLTKIIDIANRAPCPICLKENWSTNILNEWPRKKTPWLWAYHPDNRIIEEWINKGNTANGA